ncbi:hypothetical protein [Hymenobacter psoromatis]|uniref:hypothetical protein n=1 Tax=Hymenobacter psoromatis TaxID=1484116 RepID=UPI001CBC71EE|nr:hypothetical protein [Hymenobacter psoromatis]
MTLAASDPSDLSATPPPFPKPAVAAPAYPPAADPTEADYNRKTVEPQPNSGDFRSVVLPLLAQPEPVYYVLTARWEERVHREIRRTIIKKALTLTSSFQGQYLLLTLTTAAPTLRKPDPTPLEEIVLLLAALYQRLVLRITRTGQILELVNYEELLQSWAGIKQQLRARAGGGEPDTITAALLTAIEEQLRHPEQVLASLRYDYAYYFFFKNIYYQRFESNFRYGQAAEFPRFFAGTSLYFHERMTLALPTAPGRTSLSFRGELDEAQTDRAVVAWEVAAGLLPAQDPATRPLPDPAALAFAYAATYDVDAVTGWPLAIEARVNCCNPAGYAKEYDLTITRT